jgi:hypothetical protein
VANGKETKTTTTAPPPPPIINIPKKGSNKTISYLWMPDKNGNLVKADSSVVKKGFSTLPEASVLALQEYLVTVENKTQPTRAMRQTLWNTIVDGAVASFKNGEKKSPWDVLGTLSKNAPSITGTTISYTEYDKLTSDALLNKTASALGYNPALFTEQDRLDFFNKVSSEAKLSGRTVQRKAKDGGMEIVTTPSLFDAKAFTESYVWSKAVLGKAEDLPSSAIKTINNVKTILKSYGATNVTNQEIVKLGIDLASGALSPEKLKLDLNAQAQKYYPAYAERLAANPDLTMADIANPVVSILARTWEMDPSALTLDNPEVDRFLRPDGVVGKVPPPTTADIYNYAIFHPNAEKTVAMQTKAKEAAIGFARASGFGV